MTSPCGKIRIPINEEGNDKAGQIQEYLDRYHGEGIQHIAMGSTNLYDTVDALELSGVKLLNTSETYYELLPKRIPNHGENVEALKQRNILVDGVPGELLLQIFSENQLGPSSSSSSSARATRVWRRQLQGPVRDHGAGPDAPRRAERLTFEKGRMAALRLLGRGAATVCAATPCPAPFSKVLCGTPLEYLETLMAIEPVVYGASDRPPRGDYARARDDYTCEQDWAAYTEADHDTYRRLYERQSALLPGGPATPSSAPCPRSGQATRFRASKTSTRA
jgi:hypothetical protein